MMSTLGDWAGWLFYLYEQDTRTQAQEQTCGAGASGRLTTRAFRPFIPEWHRMTEQQLQGRCEQGQENRGRAHDPGKEAREQEFHEKARKLSRNAEYFVRTRLIINVHPRLGPKEIDDAVSNWVNAEYLRRWPDGMERFCISGDLAEIIPNYNENEAPAGRGGLGPLKPAEDFFSSLLYILRNVDCIIYCNGYEIYQPSEPHLRIQCEQLQLEPFRIALRVSDLKELDIVRCKDEIRLTARDQAAQAMGLGTGKKKWFSIHCYDPDYPQSDVKIEVPRDGTVAIEFPVFVKGPDVWESKMFDNMTEL